MDHLRSQTATSSGRIDRTALISRVPAAPLPRRATRMRTGALIYHFGEQRERNQERFKERDFP